MRSLCFDDDNNIKDDKGKVKVDDDPCLHVDMARILESSSTLS